jgi:hypothetical protein
MKIKKCLKCEKQLHRRKVGGKWGLVHLKHAKTNMESITGHG